ncbi:hypothetical protein ACLI4U_13035 [Natrialbaceae archaeon A-CW2]
MSIVAVTSGAPTRRVGDLEPEAMFSTTTNDMRVIGVDTGEVDGSSPVARRATVYQ